METAEERKARLAALRAQISQAEDAGGVSRAEVGQDGDEAGRAPEATGADGEQGAVLKFRNYIPLNAKLEHERVAPAEPVKYEEPRVAADPQDEGGLADVAPKKINWDLKRDVAQRLEKLERRTMRALLEMAQEEERRRVEEEGVAAEEAA